MSGSAELNTTPLPPWCLPKTFRVFQGLVESRGGISSAMATVFNNAVITVAAEGDTSEWASPDQGALLVGDHRNGLEPFPLAAILGSMGREDIHFVAKAVWLPTRLLASLGARGLDLMLPVMPRTLARDHENGRKLNRNLPWRLMQRGNLPTTEEVNNLNASTLQNTAELLANGHAVTIFPTGTIADATRRTWRHGLGKVINQVPEEARDTVRIVPFRFDTFSRIGFCGRLALASRGLEPPPQTLTLRLGTQGTINELLPKIDELDPQGITDELREQFVSAFSGQTPEAPLE